MYLSDGHLGDLNIDLINDLSPVSILDESLPFIEGNYYFSYYMTTPGVPGDPYGGTWDYSLTFNVEEVSSVPIPSAVWLFGSGLIGLIGLARRKTRI